VQLPFRVGWEMTFGPLSDTFGFSRMLDYLDGNLQPVAKVRRQVL